MVWQSGFGGLLNINYDMLPWFLHCNCYTSSLFFIVDAYAPLVSFTSSGTFGPLIPESMCSHSLSAQRLIVVVLLRLHLSFVTYKLNFTELVSDGWSARCACSYKGTLSLGICIIETPSFFLHIVHLVFFLCKFILCWHFC